MLFLKKEDLKSNSSAVRQANISAFIDPKENKPSPVNSIAARNARVFQMKRSASSTQSPQHLEILSQENLTASISTQDPDFVHLHIQETNALPETKVGIEKIDIKNVEQASQDILNKLTSYEILAQRHMAQKKQLPLKWRLQNKLYDGQSSGVINASSAQENENSIATGLENTQKEDKTSEFSDKKIILSLCAFVGFKYIFMLTALSIYSH